MKTDGAQSIKKKEGKNEYLVLFWHFPPIFVLFHLTCLVTLFGLNSGFQKLTIFGIFNELLSTQNVNIARFARNVE